MGTEFSAAVLCVNVCLTEYDVCHGSTTSFLRKALNTQTKGADDDTAPFVIPVIPVIAQPIA